jgi:flagellar motor switch/type III secretory pathway protein FliN
MEPIELALASPALASAVVEATRQAVRLWCVHWGIDPAAAEVTASNAPPADPAAGSWTAESTRQPAARLFWPAALRARIAHLLYDTPEAKPPAAGTLAARSAEHAEGELRRLLSHAWMVEAWADAATSATPDEPGPWHAPIGMRVSLGGAAIHAYVPGARFRRPPRRASAPPLAPAQARAAFGASAVHLTAVLGSAEVSVADLAALQVGDVLVLDTRVDAPLALRAEGSSLSLPVRLGRREGLRAVQFSSPGSRRS